MFTTLFSLSLLAALALAQSNFVISTPDLVQCQPAQITWIDSGNPPYDLLVVSAEDECGPALVDLGNQTSTSISWTVNVSAGTQVVLSLEDSVGQEAWSGSTTVGASNDTSCLASNSSPSPTPSASRPAPTVSSGSTGSHSSTSSSASPSPFSPAGAAGDGLVPASGALSARPLSAVAVLVSAVLTAVTFVF